jgi:hypothetical protein
MISAIHKAETALPYRAETRLSTSRGIPKARYSADL